MLFCTGGTITAERGAIPSVESKNSTTSSYARFYCSQTSGSGGYAAFQKLGTTSTAIGGANATQIWCTGDAPLVIGVNNGEKLRIKSDGKVGIGIDSPDSLLHLEGSGDTAKIKLQRTGTTIGGSINARDGSNDKGLTYLAKDGNSGYPMHVFQTDGGSGATERMRITHNGQLSIGAAQPTFNNPQPLLNIEKTSTGTGPLIFLYNHQSANTASTCEIRVGQNYREANRIVFGRENNNNWQSSAGSTASYMGFYTNSAGTLAEKLRITSGGQTRMNPPAANGSSSLISEKQALIGTKHFYSVFHTFSGGAGSVNSPLAVNSKIPTNTCGTVEIMAGWANGNGLRYQKYSWIASGATAITKQFEDFNSRYGVSISVSTPTMSISGDWVNWSFTFSDGQGNKMENLKIHFEYFHQFRVDG